MPATDAIHDKVTDLQASYDRIADEYARRIYGELEHKPFDRELLDRFAENVGASGFVCDLGCGPGHVARYLHERGVTVCGVDLSPRMIECAQRLNSGIELHQGDMRSLPVRDNTWAGVTAFYAIVNLPPADVVKALHEMIRVLQPEGKLLLSFHVGEDNLVREDDLWGTGASLEVSLFRRHTIASYLQAAGFVIDEVVERAPYAPEVEYQSRRAYIFAHKPNTKTT
jgi:ubiquinone/menaquinone biosynthesis C-methylase UbiE